MTHIKWPNNPTTPIPSQPSWQEEAMRLSALLHSAMLGSAKAEARATQLELERDALLRVVTDNHVALQRAEAAEAKLAKAVEALRWVVSAKGLTDPLEYGYDAIKRARAVLAELEEK